MDLRTHRDAYRAAIRRSIPRATARTWPLQNLRPARSQACMPRAGTELGSNKKFRDIVTNLVSCDTAFPTRLFHGFDSWESVSQLREER